MSQSPAIRGIKARIAGLKRRKRFVRWGESRQLAGELDEILYDIETCDPDPCSGAELIASFYETDDAILGNCDDSSGYVGDVYRLHAQDVFLRFADKCGDKERLRELVLHLNREDGYGIRDSLINCAASYLPEPEIRTLITELQSMADSDPGEDRRSRWMFLIESLARQVGDAGLFEATRLASWGEPSTAACIDIAEVHFESENAEAALSWLARIPVNETFQAEERDALLLRVYGQLGVEEKQAEVAWRVFRRARTVASLDQLAAVVGEGQREEILESAVRAILQVQTLSYVDAAFLVEVGQFDTAENYLAERAGRVNGDYYDWLLPITEAMMATGHPLGATVVYRALVESILKKARSNIYHYAVRYMRKLDLLAPQITNWGPVCIHEDYLEDLRTRHGRKTSFWSRYERAGRY